MHRSASFGSKPETAATFVNNCLRAFMTAGLLAFALLSWSKDSPVIPGTIAADYTARHVQRKIVPAARLGSPAWADSWLYTPAGMARDSHKLMAQSDLARLTAETQEWLTSYQFPSSCEGKKFLVSNGNDPVKSGLGSHMHISAAHMGIAIHEERIFLWGPEVLVHYTDDETCGPNLNTSCFFQPASSCTLADATRPGADTTWVQFGMSMDDHRVPISHVPTVFRNLWKAAGVAIREHEIKYWWRAQSVAWLFRFNDQALATIRELRTMAYAVDHAPRQIGTETNSWGAGIASSFPFPRGLTSIHVRHGDKGVEMDLVDTQRYLAAAEALVVHAPLRNVRAAFVSTEDPSVINTTAYADDGWTYLWYDVPRVNTNGLDQVGKVGMPAGRLTLIWFLQLFMALECDAWIGTRGSNWNRLIDELRCVWVHKCNHAFVEVGTNPKDYQDYNW